VLISALLLGCGERSVPSEPGPTPPSFRTTNSPDGPGAFVLRFRDVPVAFANSDLEEGVSYLLGSTLEELAQACAEGFINPPPTSPGSFLVEHFRPDDSQRFLLRVQEAPLLVWDDPTADICDEASGTLLDLPFAIGTGQLTVRDNDRFFSGNRANSFGFRVHGTVTDVTDGQRYHLTNTLHVTALKDGDVKVDNYEFTFGPIGR
jgi:hypothetical protein